MKIEPAPEEITEVLQVFVDRMPAGWKVYESDGRIGAYAGRRFEYLCGKRALLSAQPARLTQDPKLWTFRTDPIDRVREWASQVNVPFSAGAEVFDQGKLDQIVEWAYQRDGWLAVPYTMQEYKGRDWAEAIAAKLSSKALTLLAAVFDIDIYESKERIVRELAKACVPAKVRH